MTPKEKAQELYNKYLSFVSIENVIDKVSAIPYIKQCALIAVDEMINVLTDINGIYNIKPAIMYYQEVKQEIEKL